MFLVRLIDVFVGVLEFIFKSDKRGQGASPAVLGTAGIITLVALMLLATGLPQWRYLARTESYSAELANAAGLTTEHAWFAIGGIDVERAPEVAAAGGHRIVVVRALTAASEPARAATALREAITHNG